MTFESRDRAIAALCQKVFGAATVCDYVPNSNEPCADCPRKITMLYRCGLLQEAAAEVHPEGSHKTPVKIVAESDDRQEWCVEHSDEIGGWSGETNRRWIPKSHVEKQNAELRDRRELLLSIERKNSMVKVKVEGDFVTCYFVPSDTPPPHEIVKKLLTVKPFIAMKDGEEFNA